MEGLLIDRLLVLYCMLVFMQSIVQLLICRAGQFVDLDLVVNPHEKLQSLLAAPVVVEVLGVPPLDHNLHDVSALVEFPILRARIVVQ